jgi:DME family drug/metabolite transporter
MRSAIFVLLGGVLFGTVGTVASFAPDPANGLSTGTARMAIGGALMALFGWFRYHVRHRSVLTPAPIGVAPTSAASSTRLPIPTWLALLIAGCGMAAFTVTFFLGLENNGVALGTIITLGTSPLWAGLFDWLLRRSAPTRMWWVGTVVAIVGVVLLTGVSGQIGPFGLVMSLTAGASYGVELVTMKIALDRGWHSSDAASWVMGIAGAICLPIALTTDLSWLATCTGGIVIAWLSIATIVAAYQFIAAGLSRLPASTASTLTLAEPATATTLGLIVLGERRSPGAVAGIVLVVIALLIIARSAAPATTPESIRN